MSLHHLVVLLALLVPLSLDTFLLSPALGLAGLPRHQRMRTSLILAAFEAGMPIVGVLVGQGIGTVLGRFAGYTAAVIIGLTGLVALRPGDDDKETGGWPRTTSAWCRRVRPSSRSRRRVWCSVGWPGTGRAVPHARCDSVALVTPPGGPV